jgi:hypothetical protein
MTEVVLDASVVMKWFLADGERNPNLRDRSVLLSRRASWSSSRRQLLDLEVVDVAGRRGR